MSVSFIRLHVFIAKAGIASRRAAEKLIQAGVVRVNGQVVRTLGAKINPECDQVDVKNKRISSKAETKQYFLFNKPLGVTTTLSDPHASQTISHFFEDCRARLYSAGRLDQNSTGLLLMTNDGDLVHRLTHPRFGVEKGYRVKISKPLAPDELELLSNGVLLDGKKTAPCQIKIQSTHKEGQQVLEFILHEGRKRQIRRMIEMVGARVLTLHRHRYGSLSLGNLKLGQKRALTELEVKQLKALVK